MNRLGQLMVGLHTHAQTLHDAQLRQNATQMRLHDAMEAGLNASLTQISNIHRSATALQAAIQDASWSISQITSPAWIIRNFWTWGSLTVALTLAMIAAFQSDARYSKIVAAAIGRLHRSILLPSLM